MKSPHQLCKIIFALLLAMLPLLPGLSVSVRAAEISYPGATLGNGPIWGISDSLLPAGSLSGNTVTVNGGSIGGDVYGNDVDAASSPVFGNTIHLLGGTVTGDALGGVNVHGEVRGNAVYAAGNGTVKHLVGGWASGSGAVIGNRVVVNGSTVQDIYGGRTNTGNAVENSVLFQSGSANIIYGGRGTKADALGNTVTVQGGTITLGVYGGLSDADGQALSNSVTISGGATVGEGIIGGYVLAGSGNAAGNKVLLNGGNITDNVLGGRADSGEATGNTVTMTAGSAAWLVGGSSSTGGAASNSVRVSGGTLSGSVNGGEANGSGNADNNKIDFSNITVGYLQGGYSASGNARGNSVVMHSGFATNNIFGGYVDTGNGEASGNTAELHGGSVNWIQGGYSSGSASGNVVRVTGGEVRGSIRGGYAVTGDAINNSVYISGSPVLSAATSIWGGQALIGNTSGNALHFSSLGITANNIHDFQHCTFYMPASFTSGDTMLTLTDASGTNLSATGTTVALRGDMPGGGVALRPGTSLSLIKNANGLDTTGVALVSNARIQQGISLQHTLDLKTTPTSIDAVVTGTNIDLRTESITQGRSVAVGAMTLGADLIAGDGMGNALAATGAWLPPDRGLSGGSAGSYGIVPFAALSGGTMRYKIGDGADVNGLALMVGLAKRFEAPAADFLLGAFFEAGWASGKSYSDSGSGSVSGKTNANYAGGGILGRIDMTATALKGMYAETSLRMGHMSQKYSSHDLRAVDGRNASYDLGNTYYGIHAGLGYIWNFSESVNLDLYAKYFWNHQQGGDARIAGDPYTFDALNSHRTRVGGRVNFAVNECFTTYMGAAWEHEFDGTSRATAYGLDVPAPTVQGNTGVGELGIRFKPFASGAAAGFSVDLNAQGFVGKREGVMGNLQLAWEF